MSDFCFFTKFNIGEVWVRPWMWQCVPSVFKALQLMGCPQCNGNMIGSCTLISNKNMSTREDNCNLPMINPECWEPTITCGLRVDMDLPSKNIKCWNANNQLSCSTIEHRSSEVTAWTFFSTSKLLQGFGSWNEKRTQSLKCLLLNSNNQVHHEPNEKERILQYGCAAMYNNTLALVRWIPKTNQFWILHCRAGSWPDTVFRYFHAEPRKHMHVDHVFFGLSDAPMPCSIRSNVTLLFRIFSGKNASILTK